MHHVENSLHLGFCWTWTRMVHSISINSCKLFSVSSSLQRGFLITMVAGNKSIRGSAGWCSSICGNDSSSSSSSSSIRAEALVVLVLVQYWSKLQNTLMVLYCTLVAWNVVAVVSDANSIPEALVISAEVLVVVPTCNIVSMCSTISNCIVSYRRHNALTLYCTAGTTSIEER